MKETDPYVASRCTTPSCTRVPYREGECWLCPECAKRLRAENERLRAAATEALAVLTRLADAGLPVPLGAEIDAAKARLAGVLRG